MLLDACLNLDTVIADSLLSFVTSMLIPQNWICNLVATYPIVHQPDKIHTRQRLSTKSGRSAVLATVLLA